MKFCWRSILVAALLTSGVCAQSIPQACVESPERSEVCPNLMYKRSPVDVPVTNTRAGEIVCICMTDFAKLRFPASSEADKIEQQVELTRSSVRVGLSEQDLLRLIRE